MRMAGLLQPRMAPFSPGGGDFRVTCQSGAEWISFCARSYSRNCNRKWGWVALTGRKKKEAATQKRCKEKPRRQLVAAA